MKENIGFDLLVNATLNVDTPSKYYPQLGYITLFLPKKDVF